MRGRVPESKSDVFDFIELSPVCMEARTNGSRFAGNVPDTRLAAHARNAVPAVQRSAVERAAETTRTCEFVDHDAVHAHSRTKSPGIGRHTVSPWLVVRFGKRYYTGTGSVFAAGVAGVFGIVLQEKWGVSVIFGVVLRTGVHIRKSA